MVSVEVVLIMEGVTHVSFTWAPRWMPLYLLKKLQMRKTPILVKVTKGFRICGGLGQAHIGEKLCFEVFSIWLEHAYECEELCVFEVISW